MGKKTKDKNKLKKQIEDATNKVANINLNQSINANNQPVVIGNNQPVVIGNNQPVVIGNNQPVIIGNNQPVVIGNNQPVIIDRFAPYKIFSNNIQTNNNHIMDPYTEYKYKLLKQQNIKDETNAYIFRNSEKYKNWYNTEYKKSMEEMAEKKRRFCTGHILSPDMVFNPLIRLDFCEKCTDDTENKRMHFELKVPKYERLEYVKKELNKLETVQREIKFAYTCILNNHTGEILDLFNALFTMQNNILDNDINRFKQEKEVLLVEYYKTYDNFGLFTPPRFPVLSFTEEEVP